MKIKKEIKKEMKEMIRYSDNLRKKQAEAVRKIPILRKLLFFNWIGFKRFKRIVHVTPPFDKRHSNPKKNYGIGSLTIKFVIKGRKGCVQALISTHYYPLEVMEEQIKKEKGFGFPFKWAYDNKLKDTFEVWDIGYHSIKRPYYLEKDNKRICDLNDCGYCYYDGSSLRGKDDKVGQIFMDKGEKGIWEYLEKYYEETFTKKNPSGFGYMIKVLSYALSKKLKEKKKDE